MNISNQDKREVWEEDNTIIFILVRSLLVIYIQSLVNLDLRLLTINSNYL